MDTYKNQVQIGSNNKYEMSPHLVGKLTKRYKIKFDENENMLCIFVYCHTKDQL